MINGFDCGARTADACRLHYNSGCLFGCLFDAWWEGVL